MELALPVLLEQLERRCSALLKWCLWTQRKPLCEAGSFWPLRLVPPVLGEATGSPEGTSVSVSQGEASTDRLPLYSKYIYNFGITRLLDAQPRGIIKPTEKPVIFICYNYKYFSDGNIYTYTLFYSCSKKVCNLSKTHCVS